MKCKHIIHKIFAALLAVCLLLCSGCKQDEGNEDELEAVREYAGRYAYLNEGIVEVRKMAQVLAIYNNASYQRVKESVSVTTQVMNEYFPYTTYPGADVFEQKMTARILAVYVSAQTETNQRFLVQTAVTYYDGSIRYYWHKATYNLVNKKISEFEEIYHYV